MICLSSHAILVVLVVLSVLAVLAACAKASSLRYAGFHHLQECLERYAAIVSASHGGHEGLYLVLFETHA